jgi:hypothetical protein
MLPEHPRHRHLGSRANEKACQKGRHSCRSHGGQWTCSARPSVRRIDATVARRRWSVRPSRVDHAPPAEDRGGSPETGIVEKARIPLTYPLIIRYFGAWSWLVGDRMSFDRLRRHEYIAGLGASAAWPLAGHAQRLAMPVIGYLNSGSADAITNRLRAFRKGLRSPTRWVKGSACGLRRQIPKELSPS